MKNGENNGEVEKMQKQLKTVMEQLGENTTALPENKLK